MTQVNTDGLEKDLIEKESTLEDWPFAHILSIEQFYSLPLVAREAVEQLIYNMVHGLD